MGTNYYAKKNACPHCRRCDEEDTYHIGKSSYGWCFSLHVDETSGITDYDSLMKYIKDNECLIVDEYGEETPLADLTECITGRGNGKWCPHTRTPNEDLMERNGAERGPKNLWRHKIDGRHCVGHGEGTWDYITGEFC